MDPVTIVAEATAVANLANLAIKAGLDLGPYVRSLYQIIVNKVPLTDAQRAENLAQEALLRTMLNEPSIPEDAA